MVLTRIQDRFAYLPEKPEKDLDLNRMERFRMQKEEFREETGEELEPVSYLCSAEIDEEDGEVVLAYRVNGLSGKSRDLRLFVRDKEGSLTEAEDWELTDEQGNAVKGKLEQEVIYEVRMNVVDGDAFDLEDEAGTIKSEIILAQ